MQTYGTFWTASDTMGPIKPPTKTAVDMEDDEHKIERLAREISQLTMVEGKQLSLLLEEKLGITL